MFLLSNLAGFSNFFDEAAGCRLKSGSRHDLCHHPDVISSAATANLVGAVFRISISNDG